jgi:cytoskeleton protein RodZ
LGNSHSSHSSAKPPERPSQIGEQLRRAREASRLSVVSAAATLRLHPKIIVALEAGDFQQFEPVYVRGYLRNYARLLELAVDPLLEDYNRTLTPPPSATPSPEPAKAPRSFKHFTWLLAACALPLLLWGVTRAFQATRAVDASPPEVVARVPAEAPTAAVNPPNPPAPSSAATTTTQALALPPSPAVVAPQAIAAPVAIAPAAVADGQGPDRILLRLSASGWVSIRDHDGKRLVYETLPADTERNLQGQAPFVVVLGNAPATQIEFNGQPYSLPQVKAGTVARFTLGGAEPVKANKP